MASNLELWGVGNGRGLHRSPVSCQFIEHRLGAFQVGGVEALGRPVVDFGEHRARFVAAAGIAEQPREARRGTQLY